MTRIVRTLALLLAPAAALADEPGATPGGASPGAPPQGEIRGALPPPRLVPLPEGGRPIQRGAVLEEVIGTVREVDREHHRLTIDTAAGAVTLTLDRNTLVYGPGGLGTVHDLAPGSPVRAGRNADLKAYWVTVRSASGAGAPGVTPGQGTGPAGGAGPPAGEGSPGAPAPTSPAPGGSTVTPAPSPGGAGR